VQVYKYIFQKISMNDIKNIQFHVYNSLKLLRKQGSQRKIKLHIDARIANRLRQMGFNGRFKDASSLIQEMNLPPLRHFQNGEKYCKLGKIRARVSNPRKIDSYKSKPSITLVFFIICGST